MHATIREGMVWLPLIAATLVVAVLGLKLAPALPLVGMVSRELVQHVRNELVAEVERLRGHGLTIDGACGLVAERVDVDPASLNAAHFAWELDQRPPEPARVRRAA